MLQCRHWVISVPKKGNTDEENEDFSFPNSLDEGEELILEGLTKVKYALSDGATESAFSGIWAEHLVLNFASSPFERMFELATSAWQSDIQRQELPWYLQNKVQDGAHATFLGVELDLDERQAHVVAIGDTNLFHIKDNVLDIAFPICDASEFGNQPNLLASVVAQRMPIEEIKQEETLVLEIGDTLILSTDALAHWILLNDLDCNKPWEALINMTLRVNFKEQFVEWLADKRQKKEIKNDDTTLIIIKLSDGLPQG